MQCWHPPRQSSGLSYLQFLHAFHLSSRNNRRRIHLWWECGLLLNWQQIIFRYKTILPWCEVNDRETSKLVLEDMLACDFTSDDCGPDYFPPCGCKTLWNGKLHLPLEDSSSRTFDFRCATGSNLWCLLSDVLQGRRVDCKLLHFATFLLLAFTWTQQTGDRMGTGWGRA